MEKDKLDFSEESKRANIQERAKELKCTPCTSAVDKVWPPAGATESGPLTLVADSLAWDGVPVEAQRRLQSKQEDQEREHAAAHGRCVSSHSVGAGVE